MNAPAAPVSNPHLSASVETLLKQTNGDRASRLQARLTQEMPVLHDRLSRLYGHTPHFLQWFDALIEQTVSLALARPDALVRLDLNREAQPNWHLEGMLGYCAYTDKFAGNLAGVRKRIPHLQDLGVTYLHLLPFLRAGSGPNDGGFAVASYREIEPSLGSMADLEALTQDLRKAGISLCSDFVLNHVSHDHEWAVRARAGDSKYQSYFHWAKSPEEVEAWEANLGQIFPATAPGNFTHIPEVSAWAWTTFYPYQWDLNYAQPQVFSEMTAALLELANKGVEAFRLDSTGFLWKRAGTNCLNQPEVHWILQAMRCLVNIAAPGCLLKAEAIMPTQDLPPYFGLGSTQGAECHLAYHSSLMSASWLALSEESAELPADVLRNTPALPEGCSWMTYVRCHDDIGWNVLRPELTARSDPQARRLVRASQFFAGQVPNSYAQGQVFQASGPSAVHGTCGMTAALVGLERARGEPELGLALARYRLLHALSLFVGGLPMIYMGDEWGQGNVSNKELTVRQGSDGRELHRPFLDKDSFALRNEAGSIPGQVFAMMLSLTRQRRQDPRFNSARPLQVWETGQAAVLGLSRGDDLHGLFNFSGATQLTRLGPTGERTLAPYEAIWI